MRGPRGAQVKTQEPELRANGPAGRLRRLVRRAPHARRAAVLVCIAIALAAVSNQLNPLGLPWLLPPSGRPGVPRAYERLLVEVKAAKARALLAAGRVVFVDSRDEKDFRRDHIPGAVSVPMRDWNRVWPKVRESLPRDGTYVLYCYGAKCGLSTRQGKRLLSLGYRHLRVLEYGWKEWVEAGAPTVKHPKGQERKKR